MTTLHIVLFLYGILNIFILCLFGIVGSDLYVFESFKSALLYPKLWDNLDSADINAAGKIIFCLFIALISLPAYLIWLGVLLLFKVPELLVYVFCIVFKKRN